MSFYYFNAENNSNTNEQENQYIDCVFEISRQVENRYFSLCVNEMILLKFSIFESKLLKKDAIKLAKDLYLFTFIQSNNNSNIFTKFPDGILELPQMLRYSFDEVKSQGILNSFNYSDGNDYKKLNISHIFLNLEREDFKKCKFVLFTNIENSTNNLLRNFAFEQAQLFNDFLKKGVTFFGGEDKLSALKAALILQEQSFMEKFGQIF